MELRSGVDAELEGKATTILEEDRRHLMEKHRCSENLHGWLSENQMELRAEREMFNSLGVVGEYLTRGQYSRACNPLFGRRPTMKVLSMPGMDPWKQFMWEEMDNWAYHPGKMQYRTRYPGDKS